MNARAWLACAPSLLCACGPGEGEVVLRGEDLRPILEAPSCGALDPEATWSVRLVLSGESVVRATCWHVVPDESLCSEGACTGGLDADAVARESEALLVENFEGWPDVEPGSRLLLMLSTSGGPLPGFSLSACFGLGPPSTDAEELRVECGQCGPRGDPVPTGRAACGTASGGGSFWGACQAGGSLRDPGCV